MQDIKGLQVEGIGAIVIFTNEEMQLLAIVGVRGVHVVSGLSLP